VQVRRSFIHAILGRCMPRREKFSLTNAHLCRIIIIERKKIYGGRMSAPARGRMSQVFYRPPAIRMTAGLPLEETVDKTNFSEKNQDVPEVRQAVRFAEQRQPYLPALQEGEVRRLRRCDPAGARRIAGPAAGQPQPDPFVLKAARRKVAGSGGMMRKAVKARAASFAGGRLSNGKIQDGKMH